MDKARARELLDTEKARLTELRHVTTELVEQAQASEAAELSRVDQHPSDVASELGEREKQMATDELVASELEEVEAALERVEAGSYGTCERCGKAIAEARLEAKPAARYCIECQALVEGGRA